MALPCTLKPAVPRPMTSLFASLLVGLFAVPFAGPLHAQFADPVDLTTPREAIRDIETGDLDGDGLQDLLVVQDDVYTQNNTVWYPGLPGGGFGPAQLVTSLFLNEPELADIDDDGLLDVTFAQTTEGRIGWIRNTGGGVFAAPTLIADSLQGPRKVTPADLDGDGDLDLISMSDDPVFLDANSAIVWYENDGSGHFPVGRVVFQGAIRDPFDAEVGDLDGDGDMDIAVACLNSDDVTWFQNLGGATSWSGKIVLTLDLIGCQEIELADLENDGDLDIVVASVGVQRAAWFRNNGSGTFTLRSLSAFGLSTVDDATDVHVFDANADGFPDVAVALVDENAVDLFLYTGSGNFTPAIRITDRTFYGTAVESMDVDGDGDEDLLSGSANDAKLAWYENLGSASGTFGPNQFINQAAAGISAVAVADLNGDGDLDVVSVSGLDQKVAWYPNQGGLSFGTQSIIDQNPFFPRNLVAADLDNDGDADLAVIGDERLKLYRNSGSGTFSISTVFDGLDDARGIRAADLNGDGLPDLVVTSWFDSKLSWFRNFGGGLFGTRQIIASPGGADGLVADDWDGDGDLDLAVGGEFSDQIEYYQNLGAGTFAPAVVLANTLNGLFELESRDMNGDGRNDILFAAFFANGVGYVPNLGGGSFGPKVIVTTALFGPWSINAWDPDGDGDNELLVSVYSENRTVSIDNLGGGSFGTRRTVLNAYEYHRVAQPADLDGDGDEDLIIGFKNTVTLVENLRLSGVVCSPAAAPTGLSASVAPAGVTLTWNAVPGSVACQIQGRPLGAPNFATLPALVGTEPTAAFVAASKLMPGSSYEWKVRCACSLAPPSLTPFSALGSFSVPLLREAEAALSPGMELGIQPNPAHALVHLTLPGDAQVEGLLRISDLQGRLMLNQNIPSAQGSQTWTLDVSGWPAGVYAVTFNTPTKVLHQQLVLARE
ncbi:MAG: T9SS type A sorting domain-containing protein [Bacteroidetes bacterium]|nr:T9SS type A sorting domain-containing protein [Bacteroidota bacterium]